MHGRIILCLYEPIRTYKMSTPEEMKKNTLGGVAALLMAVSVGVGVVSCKDESAAPAPEQAAQKPAATAVEPAAPAVEEIPAPAVEEPAAPAVEEIPAPAVEEPAAPAVEETPAPAVEEPAAPAVEETPAPAVEEPAAPAVEETPAPAVEEPAAPAVEETPAPSVEEPAAPAVEEEAVVEEQSEEDAAEAAAKAEAERLAAEAAAAEAAAKAEAERIAAERASAVNGHLERVNGAKPTTATGKLYQKRLQTLLPLIAEGQDVNVTTTETKGNTALHYACASGDVELAKWLIENGADANAKTEAGKTPMECISGDGASADALYQMLKGVQAPVNE